MPLSISISSPPYVSLLVFCRFGRLLLDSNLSPFIRSDRLAGAVTRLKKAIFVYVILAGVLSHRVLCCIFATAAGQAHVPRWLGRQLFACVGILLVE